MQDKEKLMQINSWIWKELSESEKNTILSRSEIDISEVKDSVAEIIKTVRKDKDKALYRYTEIFDKINIKDISLGVSQEEFRRAESLVPDKVKKAIKYSIDNIKKYHKTQLPEKELPVKLAAGITAGEKAMPVESAGLYVPKGRGSFPSMLYMLAVPAVIAGVKRICVVTPPNKDGSVDPACLYAASLCGIKEIYRVGGAQAIAALAYGTESIKAVVKITGPGSMYVTAAKRLLYGTVDVGLPAGPSESVILADSSADPYKTALDLMIEAEHGSDSSAILVTDSDELGRKTRENIKKLMEDISEPRKTFLKDVFSGYGGIIIAESMEEGAGIVNSYAPEHLQIATENPEKTAEMIVNAGEILLGQNTPFSIANYSTGANAVLPTGGMAKTFSPVSVRDFMKFSSIVKVDKEGLKDIAPHVTALADYEGFVTHANALKLRK